ncbi:TetR/AcrR family transcriptional regulator [Nocardia spumae]|uniref:TetR/AcrR family transcriptional regulator n=1 Tax=Nocardia spumae TaxID=2887190 RepID=UPI001D156DC7|nr:TetR/AcrR family transcriptional regulator [Nocardia spumae]
MTTGAEAAHRGRERGNRSRRLITRHAVDIASLDGLGGLSFGRLAEDLELSKAGIQTLFRTKERLQLATIDTAGELFADAVIAPSREASEGAPRLHALVEHWIDYAARPLFAGGCFWGANLPDFDSHPGPVRDALVLGHRAWLGALTRQLELAAAQNACSATDIESATFQIDAVLMAANTALRLGDTSGIAKVRRIVGTLVPPPVAESPSE